MTEPSSVHRLTGLEPDNLLAFMALLGLLRALDEARPQWRARVFWETTRGALRPVLICTVPVLQEAVAQAATDGMTILAPIFDFSGRRNLDYEPAEAAALWRRIEDAGDQHSIDLFAALLPDGSYADSEIPRTPFCLLFGQGHQYFLDRLADTPNAQVPSGAERGGRKPALTMSQRIADTLFRRWKRDDQKCGFRWDPAEDSRYALRADDPSGDPAGQEYGACRLAAIGLLALPGRLVRRGSELRYLNAMTRYDGRDVVFEWPIWTRPARLGSITAMLSIGASIPTPDIAMRYRAKRMAVGKFFNITTASAV